MAFLMTITSRARCRIWQSVLGFSTISANASVESVQNSVKMAVGNKRYEKIPDIIKLSEESCKEQNPFSFLSAFDTINRTRVVDEMLQSFISVTPHKRLKLTFQYLLHYTLETSEPFSLALATLQRSIRSGCFPVPQTYVVLSQAWIDQRRGFPSVPGILLGMKAIGYRPDSGTCNFVIESLCNADQVDEAVDVLHGMLEAGCIPDVDGYSFVIAAFCRTSNTEKAVALLKEMVGKMELSPREKTLVKLAAAFSKNNEMWRADEMIEFLERKGCRLGFESYECIVEGCLAGKEFILAGKIAVLMTSQGFIPYINVRQKVVKGLIEIGEWQLACNVRHRFAELNS